MTPTPKLASGAVKRAEAGDPAAPAAEAGPYVLNLCSSSSPMALAQTDLPELKRFTFFVSRRFEEGRERFRLHMGYFASMAEAEEWLGVVRDIYPGAWAGEAPGKKLRERATAAAAAAARHAVGPQPRRSDSTGTSKALREPIARTSPVAASVRTHEHSHAAKAAQAHSQSVAAAVPPAMALAPTAPPVAVVAPIQPPAQAPSISVPTIHAAVPTAAVHAPAPPVLAPPVARPAPVQIPPRAALAAPVAPPVAFAATAPVAPLAPVPTPAVPVAAIARAAQPVQVRPTPVASGPKPVPAPAAAAKASAPAIPGKPRVVTPAEKPTATAVAGRPATAAAKAPVKSPFGNSNVREVLAALDETAETGETRLMPAAAIPAQVESDDDPSFTDTQVLRHLENRRSDGTKPANEDSDTSISLLKPDDTGTRRALKEAVIQNAPVSFAVQLQWAVQPIELDKVPPLAIFSAYTLYTVEGSRDGRKWYGLRLGFFSDAISAKQVAHYVRSEFASVAVVPVSPQEKTRATEQDNQAANVGPPKKARQTQVEEFKLIDHEDPKKGAELSARPQQRSKPAAAPGGAPRAAAAAAPRTAPQPPASAKRAAGGKAATGGGKVGARERRGPQTLEETLEILGASELEMDNGRSEMINEAGVRHLRVQVQKNTPFTRLLERLSERVKKP